METPKSYDLSFTFLLQKQRNCLNCNKLHDNIYMRYCHECQEKIDKEVKNLISLKK